MTSHVMILLLHGYCLSNIHMKLPPPEPTGFGGKLRVVPSVDFCGERKGDDAGFENFFVVQR